MNGKMSVELHLSCKDLVNPRTSTKLSPLVVMYVLEDEQWKEFARTETVKNTSKPSFSKAIHMDYHFEKKQNLKFVVHDVDNESNHDDCLGFLECSLGQVVSLKKFTQPLNGVPENGKRSTITIITEEVSRYTDVVQMTFHAKHLDNKDFLSKSDPYLEISRHTKDDNYRIIHRTEVIRSNLDPCWRMFEVPVQALCCGDFDKKIKVACYDWDDDGTHDFIGEFTTTLNEMLETMIAEKSWPCINPSKLKSKHYTNSGIVTLSSCRMMKMPTFLDFIRGGCQMQFTVGVDFTASNGDYTELDSLHSQNPDEPNEYMRAIAGVGQVCQDYNKDKCFLALGFGAQIPPDYKESFNFPLNLNPTNPFCSGVEGILEAYQACVEQVNLFGPTDIAPIINHITDLASQPSQHRTASEYFILLLLIDGVISDMEESKDAIIKASRLPISVIIIGVGAENFEEMNELHCDRRLSADEEVAARDILQVAPFRNYKEQLLPECVLEKIPKQVVEYFKMKGIEPS